MPICGFLCVGLLEKVWQDISLLLCMADGLMMGFFFFFLFHGTTSQSVTNDATNAHCTGWQASLAEKPSITKKKIVFEMLSTVVTSKHERVKVTEWVWAGPSDWNPWTGREGRRAFNPPNVHQIWPENVFHMRRDTSEKCEEVQLPSSGVIKSKNGIIWWCCRLC